jgi:hypothetical protein
MVVTEMISTQGRVIEQHGQICVLTTRPPVDNLSDEVTVCWQDARARSNEQIRKAWALMTEIAAFQGEDKEDVYREQKVAFSAKNLDELQGVLFGLSTATVSTASAFISMLVEIIIEYGIPTREPLFKPADDIQKYVYACMLHKKCCVCGKKADIHHCEGSAVGMGRNRNEMIHVGLELMPLCREHHQECHNIGQKAFNEKYHLVGIIADEMICRKVGLKYAS